jgi:hypothetical protein
MLGNNDDFSLNSTLERAIRFAEALDDACARLGAIADRYSLIATDLHRLLLACRSPGAQALLSSLAKTQSLKHALYSKLNLVSPSVVCLSC